MSPKLWVMGLGDQAPPAENGFSMLTAAIKKIQMKTAATARNAERRKKTLEVKPRRRGQVKLKKKSKPAAKKASNQIQKIAQDQEDSEAWRTTTHKKSKPSG